MTLGDNCMVGSPIETLVQLLYRFDIIQNCQIENYQHTFAVGLEVGLHIKMFFFVVKI